MLEKKRFGSKPLVTHFAGVQGAVTSKTLEQSGHLGDIDLSPDGTEQVTKQSELCVGWAASCFQPWAASSWKAVGNPGTGCWAHSNHLPLWSGFALCCAFCFHATVSWCSWLHRSLFQVNTARTNFCILLNVFHRQMLPLRCLVSYSKHHSHTHFLLPCTKLFSVPHWSN